MRSEKEAVAGPGAAVAARDRSGREKLSSVEVQSRRESPQREPGALLASSSSCGGSAGKAREEKRTVLSKVSVKPRTDAGRDGGDAGELRERKKVLPWVGRSENG